MSRFSRAPTAIAHSIRPTKPPPERKLAPARPPPAIPGFQHIRRYWDSQANSWIAQILPGEYYVTTHKEIIATVLGSCIAVCIRDGRSQLGGMNHFMLPELPSDAKEADALRYGSAAMERLVNEILKHGAKRGHLEIKVFGGGHVIAGMTDIGKRNIEFVRNYFIDEGMKVLAEDVGKDVARKVRFDPTSGRTRVMHMEITKAPEVESLEERYRKQVRVSKGNAVELF